MKKRITLFTCLCFVSYLFLTSNTGGPASVILGNYTGAHGSTASCGGSGCHGGISSNMTVFITVDSSGVPVTNYIPGNNYDIIIVGTNSVSILPGFGFQLAAVKGVGSTQVSVGTFLTPLPSGVHSTTLSASGLTILEQSHSLPASTGSYTVTVPWQAPAAGTGTVRLYCTMAMVNNNNNADTIDVCNNATISLHEYGSTEVPELSASLSIKTYPNPVSNDLHIQMNHADIGDYTFNVFDIAGRNIMSQNARISSSDYETNINTINWTKGSYFLQIAKEGATRTIQLVKE